MRYAWAICGLGLAVFPFLPAIAVALFVAPLSVWIGCRSWPVLRSAGAYGDISYGVYIYSFPVQQVVVALMGAATPYPTLLLASLSAILPMAWLSWRFVEHPAIMRKPAKLVPQPA